VKVFSGNQKNGIASGMTPERAEAGSVIAAHSAEKSLCGLRRTIKIPLENKQTQHREEKKL
jgi:hypothetical protein